MRSRSEVSNPYRLSPEVREAIMERNGSERSVTIEPDSVPEFVEVTWGEEIYQPVQYNNFRVGPFKATTIVREGETISEATARVHSELQKHAEQVALEKGRAYLANLKKLSDEVKKIT